MGTILGNAGTHDPLVRELAVGARAAQAFVDPPSPEARYPVAVGQGYVAARWPTREGGARGQDACRTAFLRDAFGTA